MSLGKLTHNARVASHRVSQTRIRTIPIFRKGNSEPEDSPTDDSSDKEDQGRGNRSADVSASSSETPATPATETQDIVADWNGTLHDGTVVRSGWFGGDSVFTVVLIVGMSVISTLFLTHGVGRLKHSKASRELRHRVRVDAPVTPRESTAQKYPTGWSMDEPSHASSTVDSPFADEGGRYVGDRLPLRDPEGARLRQEYMEAEREKYEDFKAMVDGIGKSSEARDVNGAGRVLDDEDDDAYDMLSDDDYARGSRMTFREMKERATRSSLSASRAAAHAHQASIAAAIASEACNEATAAAHRALEASMKVQRALERSSGQHIMEIYEATKKEEAIAERRARTAAEMSAKGLMEEFKAGKASKKAVDAADASRPHGVVNVAKAAWYDAKAGTATAVAHGRSALAGALAMFQHAIQSGKGFVGAVKEHLPMKSPE